MLDLVVNFSSFSSVTGIVDNFLEKIGGNGRFLSIMQLKVVTVSFDLLNHDCFVSYTARFAALFFKEMGANFPLLTMTRFLVFTCVMVEVNTASLIRSITINSSARFQVQDGGERALQN
jgi:hypothetical protein